ncbi:MAG: PilN domain-containing protein, partial [Lachnospiraceae bacterium]|nr:PilN domain-containing protein [Lachnospiraceae bacterium]
KDVAVTSYSSSESDVTIAATSGSYDAIAKMIIELKKIECISNAFVSDITSSGIEGTDAEQHVFNVTCQFVSMVEEEQIGVDENTEGGEATLETVE